MRKNYLNNVTVTHNIQKGVKFNFSPATILFTHSEPVWEAEKTCLEKKEKEVRTSYMDQKLVNYLN